jgi:hypothetical protein
MIDLLPQAPRVSALHYNVHLAAGHVDAVTVAVPQPSMITDALALSALPEKLA